MHGCLTVHCGSRSWLVTFLYRRIWKRTVASGLVRDHNGTLRVYPHNGSTTGNPWTGARSWAGSGWNSATSLALGRRRRWNP